MMLTLHLIADALLFGGVGNISSGFGREVGILSALVSLSIIFFLGLGLLPRRWVA
jgi:hypothetical protein